MVNGSVATQQRDPRLVAGVHTMVFHHSPEQAIKQHTHPSWNVVIPRAGHLIWWDDRSPGQCSAGAIFPPQVAHRTRSAAGHASVFVDPWFLNLGPGDRRPIPLDFATARQLRARWALEYVGDPDELARETVDLLRRRHMLPRAVSIDPRVVAALRDLAAVESVADISVAVGLSPSRLRALIHDQIGTSPARLRTWQRLRAAILDLATKPIALAAADAGFADQAHLTRTATRFTGQTPGDLARLLGRGREPSRDYCTTALATAA